MPKMSKPIDIKSRLVIVGVERLLMGTGFHLGVIKMLWNLGSGDGCTAL